MLRANTLCLVCLLCVAIACSTGAQNPQLSDSVRRQLEHLTRSTRPAAKIPVEEQGSPAIEHAFRFDNHTFHLRDRVAYYLLFDTPKALLFKVEAEVVSEDAQFFYFQGELAKMDLQWAFGKAPEDHFAGHAVWSRRVGGESWEHRTDNALMASPWPPTESKQGLALPNQENSRSPD